MGYQLGLVVALIMRMRAYDGGQANVRILRVEVVEELKEGIGRGNLIFCFFGNCEASSQCHDACRRDSE